jgi:hypothetical protein
VHLDRQHVLLAVQHPVLQACLDRVVDVLAKAQLLRVAPALGGVVRFRVRHHVVGHRGVDGLRDLDHAQLLTHLVAEQHCLWRPLQRPLDSSATVERQTNLAAHAGLELCAQILQRRDVLLGDAQLPRIADAVDVEFQRGHGQLAAA